MFHQGVVSCKVFNINLSPSVAGMTVIQKLGGKEKYEIVVKNLVTRLTVAQAPTFHWELLIKTARN